VKKAPPAPTLKLGVPDEKPKKPDKAEAKPEEPEVVVLDDAAVDAASVKDLRVAYRELRTLVEKRLEDLIGKRVEEALAALREQGKKTGGHRPLGFVVGKDRVLAPDKDEREIMKIAKKQRAAGMSLRKISAYLEDMGHVARSGEPFEAAQVKRLIERADTFIGDGKK
jgi:DNA invertase Pin-like site-specific DNA recombinase